MILSRGRDWWSRPHLPRGGPVRAGSAAATTMGHTGDSRRAAQNMVPNAPIKRTLRTARSAAMFALLAEPTHHRAARGLIRAWRGRNVFRGRLGQTMLEVRERAPCKSTT